MRLHRRALFVVAAVVALLALATPVGAQAGQSAVSLRQVPFTDAFAVTSSCQVTINGFATQHLVLGKVVFSTNVGTATTSAGCPTVQGANLSNQSIPFTAVDVFDPLTGQVAKSNAIVAIPPFHPAGYTTFLGLTVPTPIQAGVDASLVAGSSPATYTGDGYVFVDPGSADFVTVDFRATAVGHPTG